MISSPHITGRVSVATVMNTLLIALIPGLTCLIYFFGWGYLINTILAAASAVLTEGILLKIRKKPVLFFLKDSSALVTALLLACALPPLLPWWVVVVGTVISILFGKHLFGGLGQNPFNPAMLAYALLLVSLPLLMTTRWANIDNKPTFTEAVEITFTSSAPNLDGLTGATPLDHYKSNLTRLTNEEIKEHPIYNSFGAKGWTAINVAFFVGGLVLLVRRIITWHIPVSFLGALAIMSFFGSADSTLSLPMTLHLLAGSTMLGAFFIATDPVSAATSNRGKLIYGAGIGILVYIIRTWGNYPDATAFAVLLMNFAAPLIDHYTRPRVYGHTQAIQGFKNDSE